MNAVVKPLESATGLGQGPLVLRLRPAIQLTEQQFFDLCQLNRELRIERNAKGELELMPPVGGDSGKSEADIIWQLVGWTKRDGRGIAFSPSAGFRLPNGATRSPDAAWILLERWEALPAAKRRMFPPICPEFVVELRSPSDQLSDLQDKLAEYLANGARLGWLIDPEARRVYVYRPDAAVEVLDNPETLAGEPVLPGFILDLKAIW